MKFTVVAVLVASAVAFGGPKKKPSPAQVTPKVSYVSLAAVVDSTKTANAPEVAAAALKASLGRWGPVELAPPGESSASAAKAIAAKRAIGLEVLLTLRGGTDNSLDASLILASYPGHALKSEYRAGASGAGLIELIPPVVDQLVGNLAKDQGWRRTP